MRDYELTLIFKTDVEEKERDQLLERVQGWMPLAEGEAPKASHWGRRKLAYPIDKIEDGYYVLLEAPLGNDGLDELERNISYVEEILRHLLIRKGS